MDLDRRAELKYIRTAQAPPPGSAFCNDATNCSDHDAGGNGFEPSDFFLQWSKMSAEARAAEAAAFQTGYGQATARYEAGLAGLDEKLRLAQLEAETTRRAAESALATTERALDQPTPFNFGALFQGLGGGLGIAALAILGLAVLKD